MFIFYCNERLCNVFRNDSRDDPVRVQEWSDADLDYDKLVFTKQTTNRKYPLRQVYPGKESGLSILLNPDVDEYFCTNTGNTLADLNDKKIPK